MAKRYYPKDTTGIYGNILIFGTLVGLRPDEACQSINLIQTYLDNYLKTDWMTLEHYKYPDIFIRRTKKAYISIVNKDPIELAKNCGYNALRLYITKRGIANTTLGPSVELSRTDRELLARNLERTSLKAVSSYEEELQV